MNNDATQSVNDISQQSKYIYMSIILPKSLLNNRWSYSKLLVEVHLHSTVHTALYVVAVVVTALGEVICLSLHRLQIRVDLVCLVLNIDFR